MSKNKSKMFPSVFSHDDKHKDDLLSSKSGITKEKDTNTRMIYMDQMKKKKSQVSKMSTKSASVLQSKDLLPSYPQKISKPVDSQFRTDRLNARQITYNFPLTDLQDFKDISKNGKHNTPSVNENHGYLSQSYSGIKYHTDTSENSENKSVWMKKFDSKEVLRNYLPSEEAGSTNNKMKDAVSKIIESTDLNTDDNFPSKTFQDSSKKRHHSTTIMKKNYLSRSLSVPNYGTDTNPNINQLEDYNSVYKTSQKGIGSALSEKDFQTLLPTYTNGSWNYSGTELIKDRDLKTLTRTGFPLKVSNQGMFDLQTDDDSVFGSDLNVNQEAYPSKNAFYDDKLQISKMKEKTVSISLSPNWVFLLSKHFAKVIGILNKLLGENINFNLQNNIATVLCINTESIKSLLENDLTIIDHDPNEQSWLKANFEEWKSVIDYLERKYFCILFSETDFSKTYIGTNVADFKSIDSIISQFRGQCPTDVKISHQVMEFFKYNKTFSDLKLQIKAQDEIWIRNIKRCRLTELKKEIKKVTCQSYLLNENEYEFLCEKDNEVLSHVEEKFHMKGHPYQLPMTGDIPMVLQVNQLISISCVVNSDPENIPLDSLIIIDSQTPKPETDYVPIFQEEKYKIFQYESWNSLRNHISVFVPEMKNKTYSWNLIFENCFKIVFTDNNVPHTIGITIPIEIAKNLVQFCQNIFSAVTKLPDNDKKPTCILLFVKTQKMMDDVFNILKTPSAETPNMEDSSRSSESDTKLLDTSPKECSVDVIKGSITDMKVDVVVGSTDSSLKLNGYVAYDLSKKAGPELKRECARNYPQGIFFPQIVVTKGYKLPCNFVFFGSIPENDGKPNITTFVEACLQRATLLKFSSIAFPALGTGNLGYKPNVVVEQMASAIRKFKTTTPESSLKNIIIVIYPDEKKMDYFFKLKKLSTIVKDSKTVPPKKPKPLLQKEQKPALKVKYQKLLWIPFINYSTRRDTLDQAVMEFEKELNNVTFALSYEEAEDLYFFFDLISLVPDIVDQLCLKQENLLVPRRSSTQFEKHLNELRKHCNKSSYKIPSNVNIQQIRHFLIKINQEYTKVKCELSKDEQEVLFKTLEFERGEEAKHQLDYFLHLRKYISLSKDRFNTNKQESDDIKEHSQLPPEGHARNEALRSTTQSTQNIQNICCFQMGDSLLVKVYQADILNVDVDGIVNAANKWLAHAGGVARAIINAAGDVVNTEGQRKLNGKTLNDGEVLSTSAGKLTRYRNIIHAVGPVNTSSSRNCKKKLEETVYNSLREANQLGLHSVALPAISSGIFGVPLDICTNAYVMGVKEFYKTKPSDCQLKEIHFVDMNPVTYKAIKDDFAKQLSEVPAVTANNIHQSKYNSANIPSYEKNENMEVKAVEKISCLACKKPITGVKYEKNCKHISCFNCIAKPCTICNHSSQIILGNHPPGTMSVKKNRCLFWEQISIRNVYEIEYEIPSSYQQNKPIAGCHMLAYLPVTEEGTTILKMLQLAFERYLIFRVEKNNAQVSWADIPHKTNIYKTKEMTDCLDPNYLRQVTACLAEKKITPEDVAERNIKNHIILY